MPAGFASGMHTTFRYVTIAQARAAGFTVAEIDDERLLELLRQIGHDINRLTDQWFLPIRLREKTDGARTSVARIPNLIPILELYNLIMEKTGLLTFNYPTIAYQVKQRYVMMMTRQSRLPENPHFVILDGVFGWLTNDYSYVKTTSTSAVAYGGTEVSVTSLDGFYKGGAVLIGSGLDPASGPVIVSDISVAPPKLFFDPVEFSAPAGVKVVLYGRVPPPIQRATLLLVRDKMKKEGEIDIDEPPMGVGTLLRSESVEGYSYSLGAPPAVSGHGGGAMTTGNVEVDDILYQFACPAMYIGLA